MVLLLRGRYFCVHSQHCPEQPPEMPSPGQTHPAPTSVAFPSTPIPPMPASAAGVPLPGQVFLDAFHAVNPYASDPKEGKEAFQVARSRIFATRPMKDQPFGPELEAAVACARRWISSGGSEATWVH